MILFFAVIVIRHSYDVFFIYCAICLQFVGCLFIVSFCHLWMLFMVGEKQKSLKRGNQRMTENTMANIQKDRRTIINLLNTTQKAKH